MTRRLLFSYLGLVLLALAALEIPLGLVYAGGERDRFAASAERDAAMLAELAEEEIEEDNLAALPDLARQYAGRTGARVVVVDRRGIVLTDSGARESGADLSGEPDIAAALDNRPTIGTQVTPAGEVLSATMPGASGTTVRGALRLTYPMTAVTDRVRTIWLALALGGGSVLAAAALIALALARWVTRPVRALEAATAALADGHRAHTPAWTKPSERWTAWPAWSTGCSRWPGWNTPPPRPSRSTWTRYWPTGPPPGRPWPPNTTCTSP
ncbi:hypothetical protein AB0K16_53450 [Nonomuraea jabiensis]|uniref:hypothetical protein n=1 Tax=Nonomuraea jabiensis TaxID=882448 RepID=UPI003436BCB9